MSSEMDVDGPSPVDGGTLRARVAAPGQPEMALPQRATQRLHAFSWRGPALIVAVCLVNALRRNINSRLLYESLPEWLQDVAYSTLSGLIVAIPVVTAVVMTARYGPAHRGLRHGLVFGAAILACLVGVVLLLGFESDWTWAPYEVPGGTLSVGQQFVSTLPRYVILTILFALVYLYLRERRERDTHLRQLDADRAQFEQRTVESRLQRLQAQIEPHFLFNTLAHVKRLYQTDASAGRAMLENLMRYLAEALPQMRASRSTVRREAALTKAYLDIQKIRMGRRLHYEIDVGADVADASLPPMMLLTLVENSIKHGLTPLPQGGRVRVSAGRDRQDLVVSVLDTGRGFTDDIGSGTGLANLRTRLAALYGEQGRLRLEENEPNGVVATLRLPLHAPTAGAVAR